MALLAFVDAEADGEVPPVLAVGDVVRLHRAEVGHYRGAPQPVEIARRTLFFSDRTALHCTVCTATGPDPHSCAVLCGSF